jgi:hypothetical protein
MISQQGENSKHGASARGGGKSSPKNILHILDVFHKMTMNWQMFSWQTKPSTLLGDS